MQLGGSELTAQLGAAASSIAFQEGLAFYDAVYLAMAEASKAPLITDDRKLYQKVRKRRSLLQLLEMYKTHKSHPSK